MTATCRDDIGTRDDIARLVRALYRQERAVKMAHALQRLLGGPHGAPGEPGLALWTTKPTQTVAAVTARAPGVRLLS